MARARAVDAFVVWVLSILLAGIFLLTGVPKLLGLGTVGLQAAAMRGFPEWIRLIVGIVETVGAIALLVPAVSAFAAIVLAVLMVPAAFTQYASGEGGVWLPILLLVLLVIVAWRRSALRVSASYRDFTGRPHPLLHDGIIAGLIGAAAIALWFLIIDTIAGHPLHTPATLGHGLLGVLGPGNTTDTTTMYVLVYTVFHLVAFMLVGLLASLIVHLAKAEPSILLGFVVLFVATEIGFYGFTGLLNQASSLRDLAWYQVMLGNLIAAAAMGYYFWRTHKELGEEFKHSLDWEGHAPPHAQSAGPAAAQGERRA
jgi:uncharacterized membrane protein YphA (DoxX/SURF4 family)